MKGHMYSFRQQGRRIPLVDTLESRTLLAATKIMPLGDSITEAYSGHASYRFSLYNQLAQAGYDVDFIGGQTGVNGGSPLYTNFDQNHEGHVGYRADQVQANIISWANANKPDIVLLHIGTNDIVQGQSNSSTISDISGIIDNLRTVVSSVKILLAQIIPASTNTSLYSQLNSQIATLAGQKNTSQSPITLVDQYSGFSTSADLYDGIHPDDSGERKIANKWFAALQTVLPAPTPPPPVTYVSNLTPTSSSNGWGPIEKDLSNGETGSGDGRIIGLNSIGYIKGIGTHAGSDVRYNVSGASYSEFRADIGVDDEVGNNGSVVFQVYADTTLKYTSPTLTGTSTTQSIVVSIAGATTLRLVVTDGGNGNAYDHADWANARLIQGTPPSAPSAPTNLQANLVNQQISLTWSDNSSNESGFRIERKTGSGGTYGQIADLPAGTQSYTDTNTAASTTYYYRVYAYNSGGNSAYSNEDDATTPASLYLSDQNYTVVANGWGPAEKDRSNGESGANDGNTITLNGVTYSKGLGVHAYSEITFALNGQYSQFLSDIGVDDEVGSNASVVFQVFLDGTKFYDSGTMTGTTATKQVNVNTSGKSQLRLVVTDGGNGNAYDHADWAGARLALGTPVSPPAQPTGLAASLSGSNVNLSWSDKSSDETGFRVERRQGTGGAWTAIAQNLPSNTQSFTDTGPLAGSTTYYYRVFAFNAGGDSSPSNEDSITTAAAPAQTWLSDLTWVSATNGWGPVEKDRSNGEQGATDGHTISIRGQTYAKGLGTHPDSTIIYNLGGAYSTFLSDLGVDDEVGGRGSVNFLVYVDNVLVYTSAKLLGSSAVASVSVSVAGAQQLKLVVNNGGDSYDSDHADWAGARLSSGPNNPPATPSVTEPSVDGKVLNPADVHMEAANFSDPDGDTHASSDWEIRVASTNELIWFANAETGVEKVHIHLGDGQFTGSQTGRNELVGLTDYVLRVRQRDSRGAVSAWGTRLFSTGPHSAVVPLELQDVLTSPTPTWVQDSNSAAVDLPNGTVMSLMSDPGELLLGFTGQSGPGNSVSNPAALSAHVDAEVVFAANSAAVSLPQTKLTFTEDSGDNHTIYFPAVSLSVGQSARFWVSLDGSTYVATDSQTSPNFDTVARLAPIPYAASQAGYTIDVFATGFQLPVNIAFVPNPGPNPGDVLFYVTELYGTIKCVTRDGQISAYASNLLNFNPTGNFPGSGEQGLSGIVIDPANGNIYASMLYSSIPGVESAPHYPKVVRFTSTDGGRTAATQTTILDMPGETMGQSHFISNLSFGPDGKLYVHIGDGFDASTAQNLNSFRGKIIRINLDGTPVNTNPFYNASDGISARDFVYAYGFRNPFGGAWRQLDGKHYEVEDGPSVDRLAQVVAGRNYGYDGSDSSMTNFAIYNWSPAHAPVNATFIQNSIFGGSGFPASKLDHLFVSESGPTYATGVQTLGKRISEFTLDANGNRLTGPIDFVTYTGSGKGSVVALAAGPDGLYFSELYKDQDYTSAIDGGSRIFRVRYTG